MTNLENDTDEGLANAAKLIRERLGCDAVLITRGDRGMMLQEGDEGAIFVATAAREVYDVTGAGDTVIATLAAALATGASLRGSCDAREQRCRYRCWQSGHGNRKRYELIDSFN